MLKIENIAELASTARTHEVLILCRTLSLQAENLR